MFYVKRGEKLQINNQYICKKFVLMGFGENIIGWYNTNKRDLPWRKTNDPYKIWLSEVLLQQTRVDQGMSYYLRFVETFPTVSSLANAPEEQVLNLWQGLGYYSRARNLLFAAKQVMSEFSGIFPSTYKDILSLKGVGDYTASAIASICFGEEVAVVDGNVYRVLSRYLMINTPIDSSKGKKDFKSYATELIKNQNPNLFNQAIMELGATVCTPKKPNCGACPVNETCESYARNVMLDYPVKSKKIKQAIKYFNFLVIINDGTTYLEKREGQGIWQNLYQFPLIETDKEMLDLELENKGVVLTKASEPVKHILSHQIIFAKFWEVSVDLDLFKPEVDWLEIMIDEIESKPVPRLIENYISKLKN